MLADKIETRRNEIRRRLPELIAYGKTLRTRAEREPLDALLVDAYALVCEVAKIVVKEHPNVRRTQIEAALALHTGHIVEMQNGEGKTLAATMPAYLNALHGQHVHIATYNDYLASRDALWMGPIYAALGLKVSVIASNGTLSYALERDAASLSDAESPGNETRYILVPCSRAYAYQCDITYGSHTAFTFDYLRDNRVTQATDIVQDDCLDFIILDEADSVLIENAHTPAHLTETIVTDNHFYQCLFHVAQALQEPQDFSFPPTLYSHYYVELTPSGIAHAESLLRQINILEADELLYSVDAAGVAEQLIQSLRALHYYEKDVHYIVAEGKVQVIDQYTGRILKGSTFGRGTQQALEVKEGVDITPRHRTVASISYQHFFKLYRKVAGMTATAKEHSNELKVVYNKHVTEIPPFKPSQRKDLNDLIYRSSSGRLDGAVEEIAWRHQYEPGRPILVNVRNIEQADELEQRLTQRGIACQVLHAKHEAEEAAIIAQAGQHGTITVVAEMAGRGTDIQIDDEVAKQGGLHVIGIERHESRYMDRQLIGRAGRQGRPGSSQFFLSLKDSLMTRTSAFDSSKLWERMGVAEDSPLEGKAVLSRMIEVSQGRIARYNFEQRRLVYERDRLLDKQRTSIYRVRHKVVMQEDLSEELKTIRMNIVARGVQRYMTGKTPRQWNIDALADYFKSFSTLFTRGDFEVFEYGKQQKSKIRSDLDALLATNYHNHQLAFNNDILWVQEERRLLLLHLDSQWEAFLTRLDELQEENSLRSHIEGQSFEWYAVESFKSFQEMMERIEKQFLRDMFAL